MTETGFALHPQLAADTALVGDWPLSRVLLMDDDGWPWLILVPRRAGLREWHQLGAGDLGRLGAEIARASARIETVFKPAKVNVGMLGNRVPQFHVHVLARYESDEAWPNPVWGARPRHPYAANALDHRLREVREMLGLRQPPI
jgi:diadenosine tetraphosphate (Ap4A) HIT family hydrolase